jgi:hypothetical protein
MYYVISWQPEQQRNYVNRPGDERANVFDALQQAQRSRQTRINREQLSLNALFARQPLQQPRCLYSVASELIHSRSDDADA